MKKFIFFLGIFFLLACQSPTKNDSVNYNYFNLEDYIDQLADELADQKVNKLVRFNDSVEDSTIQMSAEAWKKELSMIGKLNIDKTSWYGYFTIDTNIERNGSTSIRYHSDQDNIPIQYLEVNYANKHPREIKARLRRSNFFSEFVRSIHIHDQNISITNSENLIFVGKNDVEIKYRW